MLSAVCVDFFVTASRSPTSFFDFFYHFFPRLRPDSLSSIIPAHALSVCAIPPRFFPLIHLSSSPNPCLSRIASCSAPWQTAGFLTTAHHFSATPFSRCQFPLPRSISSRAFAWSAAPTPCFSHHCPPFQRNTVFTLLIPTAPQHFFSRIRLARRADPLLFSLIALCSMANGQLSLCPASLPTALSCIFPLLI